MLKRNLMIGVLVIATALASSAFTLVSFSKSAVLPVGQPLALAVIDKGERDNLSLAASLASLAAAPGFIDKGERDDLSLAASLASLPKAADFIDKGERDNLDLLLSSSPADFLRIPAILDKDDRAPIPFSLLGFRSSLIVVGSYVDDHYPVQIGSNLVGVSSYTPAWYGRDSLSPNLSAFAYTFSPYLIVVGPYIDDHNPAQSGSYLVVVSAYHDR